MTRLTLLLLLFCTQTFAQQFGGFSPKAKWLQIDSDTARIIFQGPSDAQAQRVAAIVHKMAASQPVSLGSSLQKINIVLHNNTTLANGYVGLGPFRSEYYLIPGSDLLTQGNIPFHEQLAIHEYRHVQQYNNMYRGAAKIFKFFLGQEGQALANAIAIPAWFFEGDAVYAETVFTPQGRGRLPYFTNGPLSVWDADRKYSRMKWLNGSYRDYVPNHYQLGYLLTNYGYQQYGAGFWPEIIAEASAFRGLPTPLRSAIKKQTGKRFHTFFDDAFRYYQQQLEPGKRGASRVVVTNQFFPQQIGKDSLLYLENSYRQIPHFVLHTNGRETKKILRSLSSEDWFSYRNGTIAYTAFATDPRWNLTDYSNIMLLDLTTGKERKLTTRERYFTPDLSPSGKKLVAVHYDSSTRTQLHILDASTGAVTKQLSIGEGTTFFHPRFIDEDNLAVVHRRRNGSVALHRWNLVSGSQELLLYGGFNTLGNPFVANNKVYFTSSASGSDDIYAYDLEKNGLEKLTGSRTGAYYPTASADSLFFAAFTVNGLRLQSLALIGRPLAKESLAAQKLRFTETGDSINLLQTEQRSFETTTYTKNKGLINLHSWRPFYEDPELSFSAYSNNILNTLAANAFYRYNQNERSHGVGAGLTYGGFYPVLTTGIEYTFNRNLRTPQGIKTFQQLESRLGYYIPLNFSAGKTLKFFRFGSNIVFNKLSPQAKQDSITGRANTYLHHFASFSQYLPQARQHIFPKWGYALAPAIRHQLNGQGFQWLLNGQVYLPSFGNHSVVLSGSAQFTDTTRALFTNRFSNARGYADFYFPRMWRLSANYHFPIAYPDWGFGGLLYFLRLRGNVYYDHSTVWNQHAASKRSLRSTGAELFFDIKLLNQLETTIGIRHSYLLDRTGNGNRHVFAFVLPVDLIR